MTDKICFLVYPFIAALAAGCVPSTRMPPVQEPLDSAAWQQCSGETDKPPNPRDAKLAEELTTNAQTMTCKGVVTASRGNVAEGLEILNEAAIQDKTDHRPYYLAGRILAAEGRYEEALTAFARSQKRFPSLEVPAERIGRKIEDRESPAAALEFLIMARQRKLCPYGCMGLLAKLYQKTGAPDNAEATYIDMVQGAPGEPAAYVGLAGIRNRAGKYQEEVTMLEQAVKARRFADLSDGQKANIYYSLAFARYNAEEYGEGGAAIERALALREGLPEWLVLAGWIEMKQERPTIAERWFAKARLADDGFAAAHAGMGDAKIATDRVHQAIGAYQRARDLDPTSSVYMLKLAYAHALIGDQEVATRLLNDAVRLDRERIPEELLTMVTELLDRDQSAEQVESAAPPTTATETPDRP